MPPLLKALAAQYRPPLCGTERNSGFFPALRAIRPRLDLSVALSLGGAENRDPLSLAGLTTLGLILELLIVEKQLFAGGKDEIRTAIDALECLVLELH